MIYFCADDYGISASGNSRIEKCLKDGVLNKVSVLPNGEIPDFKERLSKAGAKLSLHINLVEGRPLSKPEDVSLLISDTGCFKYSFIGLLLLSLSTKRKELEKQLYKEIQSQLKFWKDALGENTKLLIDSHQHTHTIPLVFKTLMRVIKDGGLDIEYLRIPSEPIVPYLVTPSLFFVYSPVNLIKQWLLKLFALINKGELKKAGINYSYFMGVLFSGELNQGKIKKVLPKYLKLAEKNGKDIEIAFHPGYIKSTEDITYSIRPDFRKFYLSEMRKTEYDTLLNFKF